MRQMHTEPTGWTVCVITDDNKREYFDGIACVSKRLALKKFIEGMAFVDFGKNVKTIEFVPLHALREVD
jgi:hypothetical protein